MMGAPGPRFPAKFSGFLALYAPFSVERRTRGPVRHYVQEVRGGSRLRPGILHANAGRYLRFRCFVSGADFSRAAKIERDWAFLPLIHVETQWAFLDK